MMRLAPALWIFVVLPVLPLPGEEAVLAEGLYARIETSRGEILFSLDYQRMPLTVSNFVALAEGTMDGSGGYYDGQVFYRRIKNYALFFGDPSGRGDGGVEYTFPREDRSLLSAGTQGALTMVTQEGDNHGSRVMILIAGDSYLDRNYSVFGQLQQGKGALRKLREGDSIVRVEILRVGSQAENFHPSREEVEEAIVQAKARTRAEFLRENPQVAQAMELYGGEFLQGTGGYYYQILEEGEGDPPALGNSVRVHYSGTFLDGIEFDSSYRRGIPFQWVLGQDPVIPGWLMNILRMKPGEQRLVFLPPSLAYGEEGNAQIPPRTWLVFEIELLDYRE